MARFLAYTSPARGHLYPILPTLIELSNRGHEVHVRTLASEIDVVTQLGMRAQAIDPAIEADPLDDWQASTPQEGLGRIFATFARRAEHEVPDLRRALAEVKPDALLVDITTVGAAAVAEASGLPWASWVPYFLHFDAVTGPSKELSVLPFSLGGPGLEAVNAPRRELGVDLIESPAQLWRAPLYLYFTAEPFEDVGREIPPSVRLVGPGLWDPPSPPPAWLDDLRDPVVLVVASSERQADHVLIDNALKALAHEDLRMIVTTAAHDAEQFHVPDNARVLRWLPHSVALQRAACVVCHGGMGITQKALAAGVPVCVAPFGRDQAEVASRVTAVDAGTVVLPQELSPDVLREAVHSAMAKRTQATAVAEGFARAGGARAAADHLGSLLGGKAAAHVVGSRT